MEKIKKTKQTAVKLDQATWEWLEQESLRTGKTPSALLREGIELLKAEVRLLTDLKARFEASGVAYPSMKTQTATGV
ncbi:hypothetical protein, partial [uncultured Nostoc sp.]|uniref:hypothetical protein n=1 Tax=uncultured Nostoc sp. TaxID=340711 RepID=UPI0035CB8BB1